MEKFTYRFLGFGSDREEFWVHAAAAAASVPAGDKLVNEIQRHEILVEKSSQFIDRHISI